VETDEDTVHYYRPVVRGTWDSCSVQSSHIVVVWERVGVWARVGTLGYCIRRNRMAEWQFRTNRIADKP